jgi:transmembrane sensor
MDRDKLLHKFLNSEASLEEIEQLKADPIYQEYILIASASSEFEVPAHDAAANFKKILDSKKDDVRPLTSRWISFALRIAAILLVLVSGYIYFQSLSTSIDTKVAEIHSFELPDRSMVYLNANSSLSYNKRSWDDQREVELQGEAFFKVEKGETFEVITDLGSVTVLGTQFNVFARNDVFRVSCFEGLVAVRINGDIMKLAAGERLKFENGKLESMKKTSTQPAWMYKESNFENSSLTTVLQELKNQYPIEISWPKDLNHKRFTGSFTHTDLEVALKSICAPLNLTYEIDKNQVTIYEK